MAGDGQPVALVSGASRGIGREVARQLAADHGFLVLAGARDPEAAGPSDHERITFVRLDVADQASVDRLADQVGSDPGRLDVLVNNAGIGGRTGYQARLADADLGDIKEVLETNLFGALRLTKAMLPLLGQSPHPRVVNVSSGAGQLDEMNGGIHGYRLSKVGLNALTRILADDEAESRLLVNSMCPGWVRTDMGGPSASRSVEEGADTAVWLATLPDDGPSGGFFRDRKPIPW
ncbi:MAG: SDR family oxidoreductase [Actinomycetota bacterium]|nr:SDR family oxidoreductase [Actinomycetota bacterium]